ncbi:OmpA family protein [Ectothiorhodospira lacustris]|uniref:OmpA family protein n=1 Tax=Ectothiorhodospira lacustris TaxID=2899127 RepID=UPI001EE8B3F4|nr:OmpA family protein [Ectothiorhodospira lacustris]MCG5510721.1 OmpA family protein [Ectothiorhodospira lacustris]MCG5522379.1 OmpA family protein [Ectothiorhodospira lacustris]
MNARYAILLFCLPPISLWAADYGPRMEQAQWIVTQEPDLCELIQPIPRYGIARFQAGPGRTLSFHLDPRIPLNAPDVGLLSLQAPDWRHDLVSQDLGAVPALAGDSLLRLGREEALTLYYGLETGHEVLVQHPDPGHGARDIRVTLSPLRFREVLADFRACQGELRALDFEILDDWRIHFDFDEARIRPDQYAELDRFLAVLRDSPAGRVVLGGHADERGTEAYNDALSLRRAHAVQAYLQGRGIAADRIETRAFGQSWPLDTAGTEAAWALNRRVDIWLAR